MAQAANVSAPLAPTLYPVYRGFYILPSDDLSKSVVRIDFFVARSVDDLTWENWTLLGYGTSQTGMYAVHSGLDENIYYAYYVQYVYSDGSKTPVGAIASSPAQLIASSTLNIDQLASRAYSTGLITAGIFRGVVFETSITYPKVRMDPTGIFAYDGLGSNLFYLHADGSGANFSGAITLSEAGNYLATPTIGGNLGSVITWGGNSTYTVSSSLAQGVNNQGYGVGTGDRWLHNTLFNPPRTINSYVNLAVTYTSQYLYFTQAFNIPSNATITGVSVSLDFHSESGAGQTPSYTYNTIQLLKGGALVGANKGPVGPQTTGTQTVGASNDLWSTTLTPTDTNSGSFGVAIVCSSLTNCTVSNSGNKGITITVYYSAVQTSSANSWVQGIFDGNTHKLVAGAPGSSNATTATPVTVIDEKQRSNFLQLKSSQNLQIQTGSGVFTNVPIGPGTYQPVLDIPWPNNHLNFIGTVNPVSSIAAGNYLIGSRPVDLTKGQIQLASSVVQNWNYWYISIGN